MKPLFLLMAVSALWMLAGWPADADADRRHGHCATTMSCGRFSPHGSNENLTPRMAETRDACAALEQRFDRAIARSGGSPQAARARQLGSEGAGLCSSNAIQGVARLEEALSLI